MYIESVNLGIDHLGSGLLQHLGIKFFADGGSYEVDQLVAQYATFMDNLNFSYTGGTDPHFSVDRLVANQATCLFKSEDGSGRMFAYDAGNYRAISSSVVFGAIKNGDSLDIKAYMMAEMINFLLGVTTITSVDESVNQEDMSVVNYPNPFTEATHVEFSLVVPAKVSFDVYDEMGRLIYIMGYEQMAPGRHMLTWDARDQQGNGIHKGVYFYRLTINEKTNSGKFLLTE